MSETKDSDTSLKLKYGQLKEIRKEHEREKILLPFQYLELFKPEGHGLSSSTMPTQCYVRSGNRKESGKMEREATKRGI
ncbi:unnamed protein product, partial [Sphenostylis stenocarpa]